jgi:hypothetical protein
MNPVKNSPMAAFRKAEARLREALETYDSLFLSRTDSVPVNSRDERAALLEIVDATAALRELWAKHQGQGDAAYPEATGGVPDVGEITI